MNNQSKTNNSLAWAPYFQKKMGEDSTYSRKNLIIKDKVAVRDITIKEFVRKYHKESIYFSKTVPVLRKHIKQEETYFKKSIPLPITSGNLPEITLIHQLRDL